MKLIETILMNLINRSVIISWDAHCYIFKFWLKQFCNIRDFKPWYDRWCAFLHEKLDQPVFSNHTYVWCLVKEIISWIICVHEENSHSFSEVEKELIYFETKNKTSSRSRKYFLTSAEMSIDLFFSVWTDVLMQNYWFSE